MLAHAHGVFCVVHHACAVSHVFVACHVCKRVWHHKGGVMGVQHMCDISCMWGVMHVQHHVCGVRCVQHVLFVVPHVWA